MESFVQAVTQVLNPNPLKIGGSAHVLVSTDPAMVARPAPVPRARSARELRANLSLALDDAAESLPREEAARIARRDFGNLTRAKRKHAPSGSQAGRDLADLRFAWRALYRAPAFTLVAILSCPGHRRRHGLFSLVNTVVLKPLAYREPGRLVYVREVVRPCPHLSHAARQLRAFRFWREHTRLFESLSALARTVPYWPTAIRNRWYGAGASNFFETLGVQPQIGGPSCRMKNSQPEPGCRNHR